MVVLGTCRGPQTETRLVFCALLWPILIVLVASVSAGVCTEQE